MKEKSSQTKRNSSLSDMGARISTNWLFTVVKVILMAMVVSLTALILNHSVPIILGFLSFGIPRVLIIFAINCIIIAITGSSLLHHRSDDTKQGINLSSYSTDYLALVNRRNEPLNGMKVKDTENRSESSPVTENLAVSIKFDRRDPVNNSVKVSENQNKTLESMWKEINDGRLPKKCDTSVKTRVRPDDQVRPSYKKSETFDVRNKLQPSPAFVESSVLSRDELNRRAEAFINKFNEEMRLQREKSLENYIEMVNRGSD